MPDVFLAEALTQTATYWAPGDDDAYGQRTPGSPVSADCRWEERAELFIDERGAERRSAAVAYVDQDMEVGGWLALGDLTATSDPRTLSVGQAWPIRGFKKVGNIEGTEFTRKAFL